MTGMIRYLGLDVLHVICFLSPSIPSKLTRGGKKGKKEEAGVPRESDLLQLARFPTPG